MIKRPQSGETEEDILRMQNEFLSQRAKNPKLQPSAQVVKVPKETKKSLFVRSRQKASEKAADVNTDNKTINVEQVSTVKQEILGEIHEKIVGNLEINNAEKFTDIVLGDIVEKKFDAPMLTDIVENDEKVGFPTIKLTTFEKPSKSGKSIFATAALSKQQIKKIDAPTHSEDLSTIYGNESVIVSNSTIAAEVHKENLDVLSKMSRDDILAEREKLLNSIDPTLLELLKKRRQEKSNQLTKSMAPTTNIKSTENVKRPEPMDVNTVLTPTNAAYEILQQSEAENWVHFNVVETDKLKWMRDVGENTANVKPGEQFEARFDWKGVLLPYAVENVKTGENTTASNAPAKDDRELYLHGEEPHRPGYTLQELFRLARSNIMQQRISAFGAIGGILSIYNQGFYDGVLELPISKIFFLLRLGLDDNTPAVLEVVSRALAFLFYNEADETLLDFIFDNPGCHWQPSLATVDMSTDIKDLNALENLQKQMQQLQMHDESNRSLYRSDFEDNENEESKTSMSDFQLAETNLIECLLRTNILQRIYFVLSAVKPENSTVTSCVKLLIRLARTNKEIAGKIVANNQLMQCIFEHFLPDLTSAETNLSTPQFYNQPQFLCLKLVRILITQNLGIAVRLMNMKLSDILINYLSYRSDIKVAKYFYYYIHIYKYLTLLYIIL
uniref:RNA polymerase II-associated protein 1 n=1 Tax=Zeugodacus cucurbitae TaxID=28588 RepID=A0A0A1WPQ3_ZEUCU